MKVDNRADDTRKTRPHSISEYEVGMKALYIKLFTVWEAFLRETVAERFQRKVTPGRQAAFNPGMLY